MCIYLGEKCLYEDIDQLPNGKICEQCQEELDEAARYKASFLRETVFNWPYLEFRDVSNDYRRGKKAFDSKTQIHRALGPWGYERASFSSPAVLAYETVSAMHRGCSWGCLYVRGDPSGVVESG